ncbi:MULTISPECIES: type VI secretion system protein TssA [unclassified Arsukibacterium]|uniref:type VI secretion system protein TssA n=1 Tax=unclassified Arsukibacterium TaxID=2635278 RepID=UPI000C52415F|nr:MULTISPECIES: type VI secretion system protein TssA [unclassified Arsukibacterium]MAA93538.1 type VI secretion system protein TssA [Rheinheimera sp.]MBM33498.1 type VI secretion system protein TssA [Rheinheimera sp.]HAW91774.1 type VI secretion system protein TssA [Candidatus Azambacteria bacterium]|tara:strand:- start:21510 stop:22598 length:1089 start_codon:yes stop_codon:yes gene_type:complete
MDRSELIDFELLIKPVAEHAPTGIDPRSDISPTSQYYTLKDVRSQARANERAMLFEDEDFQALVLDWRPLAQALPDILAEQSKDLEYAAWLIEAWCRTEGFAGLAAGFKVTRLLIEHFWQDLYPLPDDEGMDARIAPLVGLNGYEGDGALITPILSIPITDVSSTGCFACWQYVRAADLSRKDESKQKLRADAGIASLEQIQQAVQETPAGFYQQLYHDIQQAISEFKLLSDAMDAAMAGEPQPTTAISKAMQKCLDAVSYLAADKLKVADDSAATGEADFLVNPPSNNVDEQLQSRQQVIRSLQHAVDFFRKTEPHSPMSYALEQVIRWSDLTLPELLQELIDDNNTRNSYFRLAGIPQTK